MKKHLKGVYLQYTGKMDDDFFTESLRNAVHHLGYTRNLLFHNGQPSTGEVISCLNVSGDICSAFENSIDPTKFAAANQKLKDIIDQAKRLYNLSVGEKMSTVVDQSVLVSLVLDKALSTFEEKLLSVCMTALSSEKDLKEICELLYCRRGNQQFRDQAVKIKKKRSKGRPLEPFTEDQLKEIDAETINKLYYFHEIAFQKVCECC